MPRGAYELTTCPVCGSRDGVTVADEDALRSEVELLWAFHGRRLRPDVPREYLNDRVVFSQYPPLQLTQCARCSHVYRNPWERRETLQAAYDDIEPDDAALRALFDTQREAFRAQVRRLTAVTGRIGRGLEVGSYAGGFLAAAADVGWMFDGVDVSERAANFAMRSGLRVTRGQIDSYASEQPLDAVAMWNTFEQLYDARSALFTSRQLLREGGILVVRVPNGGFYVDWRKRLRGLLSAIAVRVLAHNNMLSFPYRQGFTMRSLVALLSECHLTVVKVFGDTLVPIADEWTTTYGTLEERAVKHLQRLIHIGWTAPWVEVYARAT